MSAHHHLPVEPIRSKGQATLLRAGFPDMPVTVRDISAAGIGVVAASFVDAGRAVVIHIHGHTASGVVENCRVEDEGFYIAIALAP